MALNIPGGEFLTGSLDVISQSLTIPVLIILIVIVIISIITLGGAIAEYTSRRKVPIGTIRDLIYDINATDSIFGIIGHGLSVYYGSINMPPDRIISFDLAFPIHIVGIFALLGSHVGDEKINAIFVAWRGIADIINRSRRLDRIHRHVVDMRIAQGVHEIAYFQPADLGDHVGQGGIGRDIERHSQEQVGRTLVKLAAQSSRPSSHRWRGDIELEEGMTGWQGHLIELADIPGRHDMPARVRVGGDRFDDLGELVDLPAARGWPAAPLVAIDGAEFTGPVSPLVPDVDAVLP